MHDSLHLLGGGDNTSVVTVNLKVDSEQMNT